MSLSTEERRILRRLRARKERQEMRGFEPRHYTPADKAFARRLTLGCRMMGIR